MADINDLKLTGDVATVDFDNYAEPSEFPPPVPAGVYTLTQGKPTFEASKEGGFLQAAINHKISGGEFDGIPVNFDRISNKTFERQGTKANMMVDQLRALGNADRPTTHQEYATAIEAGEGRPFKAQLDWEAYCKACQTSVKGMRNFPSNGTHNLSTTKCPKCGVDIDARHRITRRIPA